MARKNTTSDRCAVRRLISDQPLWTRPKSSLGTVGLIRDPRWPQMVNKHYERYAMTYRQFRGVAVRMCQKVRFLTTWPISLTPFQGLLTSNYVQRITVFLVSLGFCQLWRCRRPSEGVKVFHWRDFKVWLRRNTTESSQTAKGGNKLA